MASRSSGSPVVATLVILLSLPLGACASSQSRAFGSLDDDAPPGGALITVENRHVLDMRVYLVRGSNPLPLGTVGTLERRTFPIPTAMLGHQGFVRLMADPVGSRDTHTSDWIPATPGDHLRWTLEPSLTLSTFSVRRVAGRR